MKRDFLSYLGVLTVFAAISMNFSHTLDDYGIKRNKLHVEVLAMSGSSGGGTGGGGVKCVTDCDSGGCGAISCSIEYSSMLGQTVKLSVEAGPGYYACCYDTDDFIKEYFAKAFPNSCCES